MTTYKNVGVPDSPGSTTDPTAPDTTLYDPVKEPVEESQAVGGQANVTSWNTRTGAVVPLNGDYTLDLLGDVDLTGLTDSQTIVFNQATGNFEPADFALNPVTSVFSRTGAVVAQEGDYTLDLMGDVVLNAPTANQVLTYNAVSGVWENQNNAAAAVLSVFGRTGTILAQSGDYAAIQIAFTPAGELQSTDVQNALEELDSEKLKLGHEGVGGAVHANATTSVAGFMSAADKTKLDGIVPSPVVSVFGRSGAVVAEEGDYTITLMGDVNFPVAPQDNDVLTFNSVTGDWEAAAPPGSSGGEANTASNLGAGAGVFQTKVGVDLRFNTLVSQSAALTIVEDVPNNEIDFAIAEATGAVAGLMAAADKTKLDGIPADATNDDAVNAHIADAVDAHAASAIANTPAGTIAATNVQSAINELNGDFTGHQGVGGAEHALATPVVNGFMSAVDKAKLDGLSASPVDSVFGRTGAVVATAGDYTGAQVTNVPSGTLASTDVQGAINELEVEKLTVAHEGAGGAVHPDATGAVSGFMSAADKAKLDTLAVVSVFGRTGTVVAAANDYTAAQVQNAPSGFVAATTVQGAIDELDAEKPQISTEDTLLGQMQLAVVSALPGTPDDNTIYFVV